MRRKGTKNQHYYRRIPADVRDKAAGLKLAIPVGDETTLLTISPKADALRISLRTDDPAQVKARNAAVDAYLENIWQSLREDAPVSLSHEQVVALSGELYRAWANGEGRVRTTTVEQGPDGKMRVVESSSLDDAAAMEATLRRLLRMETLGKHEGDKEPWNRQPVDLDNFESDGAAPEPHELERHLGALVDRLLRSKRIGRVDVPTRELLLVAFWRALVDGFKSRLRIAEFDYTPDPKAKRFPSWQPSQSTASASGTESLTGLVVAWWKEEKARGLKPSTHESYSNTMKAFVAHLGHDDASRVTSDDVRAFKDHRLATVNPRTGRTISAKTVKDNDLAGLKALFGWGVANGKMASNPAAGVTLKTQRTRKLRGKGFTDEEAEAILKAALMVTRGKDRPETFAAKRWVPWLMAYSGARVGELAQLRKQDLQRKGEHWFIIITPEAGTVKTDEARSVALHPHLVEMGFVDFVEKAPQGHLFLRPAADGDVLGPLQGVNNRLAEFARAVVADRNVAPNHGWRHRFKTLCRASGIDRETRDYIQGHAGRTDGEEYGDVPIEAQVREFAKFPRHEVS